MLANLTGWHFLILLAVILLIFGAAKLPALARSMGQSARVFKGEMRALREDEVAAEGPVSTPRPEELRVDGAQSADGLRSS